MNLSPAGIALVKAKVTDWTPSDAAIAATLNTPSIANPTPQATVPKPFAIADIFGAIAQASLANFKSVAYLPDIRDKIQANDVAGCSLYANLLLVAGVITQADETAILAIVTAKLNLIRRGHRKSPGRKPTSAGPLTSTILPNRGQPHELHANQLQQRS